VSTTPHPTPIAFCITELEPGGAERALVEIVIRLDRGLWSPTVLCLSGRGPLAARLEAAGVPVRFLDASGRFDFRLIWRLKRELAAIRPALLQTFLFHANLVGRIAARWCGVPHVVSGIRVAEQRSRFRLWLDRVTERWVERHVCVSQDVAFFSTTTGGLSRNKVVVIENGVDAARFTNAVPARRTDLGIPEHATLVLAIGRLDRQKGFDRLIEAVGNAVHTESSDAPLHMLIAGEGPERASLHSRIAAARLSHRIKLLGYREDVPELLRAADLFVLSSLWEGQPNVVLEAMAAGCPVVAVRVHGVTELVTNETGWLAAGSEPVDISAAIHDALNHPAERAARSAAAQRFVIEKRSWDDVARQYSELYGRLLADGG
jgi:glycosyltransferase involved in cell wall biosynthesis